MTWTLGGWQFWTDVWVRSGWRVQEHATTRAARLLDPGNRRHASGRLDTCVAAAVWAAPGARAERGVILLHGLGRTRRMMAPMAAALQADGWAVAALGYASLRRPFEDHVAAVASVARALQDDGGRRISIVGHSLGGLIARAAVAQACVEGWEPDRLVLIGSPARGSAVAARLKTFGVYRSIMGACGQAVTPALAAHVPVPDAPIGVIAGGNLRRGYNPFLAGDNDGLVTVAETRLPGAESAFLLVPAVHTFIARNPAVIAATCRFLATGCFRDNSAPAAAPRLLAVS
ncbi:MAG: alpha/beta fold hydrolase [Proteobacteria bacterium]|nr:alpha/beta fold hydrolase [Pseudomonadota bacterium]